MSLLARSGGVKNEFTFTGGVANNAAAVAALRTIVTENYGELTMNISPDSIYTGALGAAIFAYRDVCRGGGPRCMSTRATTEEFLTAGIDVGSASVKVAVVRTCDSDAGGGAQVLAGRSERIRRRSPEVVVESLFESALAEAGVARAGPRLRRNHG